MTSGPIGDGNGIPGFRGCGLGCLLAAVGLLILGALAVLAGRAVA